MTKEELARNDGREGRKAFVAVNGTVYDFTDSKLWANGEHEGLHQAGRDLTEDLKAAPHVRAVVERFPIAGTLEEPAPAPQATTGGAGKWIALAVVIVVVLVAFLMLR